VADDTPLRADVPTLHMSTFAEIIKQSGIERFQGLINPKAPATPFGFVNAPRLERGVPSSLLYIVPSEVIEHHAVQAWRVDVLGWQPISGYGPYWKYVTHAEPLR
jgi:hypothetical protein